MELRSTCTALFLRNRGFKIISHRHHVCFFKLTVNPLFTVSSDLSPPTFHGTCPSQMVFYTDSCDDSAVVSWSDPVATDYSGTTVMTYPPVRPPVNLTVGLYEISYTATDKSGNTANCSFVVQVTSKYFIQHEVVHINITSVELY